MRLARWIPPSILVAVLLLYSRSSAQIEQFFATLEVPASEDGLVFEIALPKHTYFFFEPLTVLARFRNVGDEEIALVLEEMGLSGIDSKLSWEFSSPGGQQHRPTVGGSSLHNVLVIPRNGSVFFALPDRMFPVGTTKIAIQYSHLEEPKQTPLPGAQVWRGQIRSNEVTVVVQDKETLTREEQASVEDKVRRHVDLFSTGDWATGYRAESYLVRVSKYSVPILLESLRHGSSLVRAHSVDTLGRIADKELAEELGFNRDTSFLNELLLQYDRERDPVIKAKIVYALVCFKDTEAEQRMRIVETLRTALSNPDRSLRKAGAVALLTVSPSDGIPEVIKRIGDTVCFGDEGQRIVLRVLQEETGQDFGASPSQWMRWWQKHQSQDTR